MHDTNIYNRADEIALYSTPIERGLHDRDEEVRYASVKALAQLRPSELKKYAAKLLAQVFTGPPRLDRGVH